MNYIGSKKRLLNFLYNGISEITGLTSGTFFDGFAGTGSVGKFFQEKGFSIIANDIQYYSFIVNNGKLNIPENNKKMKKLIMELHQLGEDYEKNISDEKKCFIYNNYCAGGTQNLEFPRLYFSDENGKKCDVMRMKIEDWKDEKKVNQKEYFYLIYCLLEAIDRVANTASVYGAYLKKLKKTAQKSLQIKTIDAEISSQYSAKIYNDAIENLMNIETDILYLDPPYNNRQYAPNYHVLETIAKYDNPELRGKTGLRNYEEQKSDFCMKAKVEQAFEYVIQHSKAKYIFLSYNNEGIMSSETIQNILKKYGESGFFTQDYGRFKADKTENRNHKANSVVEYLHWVKKN